MLAAFMNKNVQFPDLMEILTVSRWANLKTSIHLSHWDTLNSEWWPTERKRWIYVLQLQRRWCHPRPSAKANATPPTSRRIQIQTINTHAHSPTLRAPHKEHQKPFYCTTHRPQDHKRRCRSAAHFDAAVAAIWPLSMRMMLRYRRGERSHKRRSLLMQLFVRLSIRPSFKRRRTRTEKIGQA